MDGFSADGYIIDQNAFAGYRYREMSSDINGCGWIAGYNLLRAAGFGADHDAVRRELDGMIRLRIPGPTPMRILRRWLNRYGSFRYTAGRKKTLAAAGSGAAGILRYWEGNEPHFITFLRLPDGRCRFLNVADGQEDIALGMEEFFESHCRRGFVRGLILE